MAGDAGGGGRRYADRSDGAERKIALPREARERGDFALAIALADSLKDGLTAESRLRTDPPPQPDLPAGGWRPVAALPASWAAWAAGWSHVQTVALTKGSVWSGSTSP